MLETSRIARVFLRHETVITLQVKSFCVHISPVLFLAFMYTNIIARLAFIQILHPNYHKHKRWQECFLVVYRVYEVRRQEISFFSPFTPKIGQNFQISSCKMLRIDSPLWKYRERGSIWMVTPYDVIRRHLEPPHNNPSRTRRARA